VGEDRGGKREGQIPLVSEKKRGFFPKVKGGGAEKELPEKRKKGKVKDPKKGKNSSITNERGGGGGKNGLSNN